MPNRYARLSDMKSAMQGSGSGTSNDDTIMRMSEQVSRGWDSLLGRRFYAAQETLILDGDGSYSLWLGCDLQSVSSLALDRDGDGIFETTIAADGYHLWPANEAAKRRVDLVNTFLPCSRRAARVVGFTGYADEQLLSGAINGAIDASTDEVTLESGHDVERGDTIWIDDEQMDVLRLQSNVATVIRGVNGTTAATHEDGASVFRQRYPRDIELATTMQVARFAREAQTGFSGGLGGQETSFGFNHLYPAIRDLLAPYHAPESF